MSSRRQSSASASDRDLAATGSACAVAEPDAPGQIGERIRRHAGGLIGHAGGLAGLAGSLAGRIGRAATSAGRARGDEPAESGEGAASPGCAASGTPGTRHPLAALVDVAVALWRRTGAPDAEGEPFRPGLTSLRRTLWRAGILGFVASVAIVLGASQQNSPYTLKLPGAWWYGIPTPQEYQLPGQANGSGLFLGMVAVYGGMLLLIRCWYDVVRGVTRHRGTPVARLVPIFAAWSLPLLFVAPLFSHDLYSYAAQGEMVSHHINPYTYGPDLLGPGSPFFKLVDHLWANVPSPYGPVFLELDGWIVSASGHHPLVAIEGLRLLALLGVALFAWAIPVIARSFGRDPGVAFALSAISPLVLLHLVGGGHNDALMLGVLAVGYALARRKRYLAGLFVVGLAASVKIPALIGAVYIGWEWLGPRLSIKARIRPVVTALLIAVGVMAALSELVGFGWGWIGGLSNPDVVRSWLDPATGLGLLGGKVVGVLGLGSHTKGLITLARGSGLLLAAVAGVVLLLRSDDIGPLRALGWSLVLVVLLGPVIQPWYASWGFVFLAPVVVRRSRRFVMIFSAVSCFLGLPGGAALVHELGVANPLLLALTSAALVGLGALMVLPHWRAGARAARLRAGGPDPRRGASPAV